MNDLSLPRARSGHFQTVENYTPPQWPGPASAALVHLDVLAEDLAAAEARV